MNLYVYFRKISTEQAGLLSHERTNLRVTLHLLQKVANHYDVARIHFGQNTEWEALSTLFSTAMSIDIQLGCDIITTIAVFSKTPSTANKVLKIVDVDGFRQTLDQHQEDDYIVSTAIAKLIQSLLLFDLPTDINEYTMLIIENMLLKGYKK